MSFTCGLQTERLRARKTQGFKYKDPGKLNDKV